MPKKTRAQKIIAKLRRELTKKETKRESSPQKKPFFPKETLPEKEKSSSLRNFVVNDLKKSLFLFSLAIALQLVLYYLLELEGLRKFDWIILLIKLKWKLITLGVQLTTDLKIQESLVLR